MIKPITIICPGNNFTRKLRILIDVWTFLVWAKTYVSVEKAIISFYAVFLREWVGKK
jgi:hypothetical protein